MTDFSGRRIAITGATSGIGSAGARRLAADGAELVLTGTRPDRIDALRKSLPQATVVANDAKDPASAEELAAAVRESVGGLDGLWLNAGYAVVAPPEEITAEAFDDLFAVNVRAPFLQLAALSPLLSDGASVVVTSSTAAYEGSPIATVYAAAKGAVVSAVRGWAAAFGGRGIRVNTLVPGPIDTDFRRFMSDDTKEAFESDVLSRVPLSRSGTADEAAAVALFLLSDEAAFVTGAQYAVDGGLTRV